MRWRRNQERSRASPRLIVLSAKQRRNPCTGPRTDQQITRGVFQISLPGCDLGGVLPRGTERRASASNLYHNGIVVEKNQILGKTINKTFSVYMDSLMIF